MKKRFELSPVFSLATCFRRGPSGPAKPDRSEATAGRRTTRRERTEEKLRHRRRSASPTRIRSRKSAKTERVMHPSTSTTNDRWSGQTRRMTSAITWAIHTNMDT
jgi:hypothetical protein